MATTTSLNQINYSGKGNLDPKMNAVPTLNDLYSSIPRRERREGMCVTVLNADGDNKPYDYWLIGGTADTNWIRKKTGGDVEYDVTGDDVEQ